MKKYILTAIILFAAVLLYSQDNSKYVYRSFPIATASKEVIIAGDVNTYTYTNYFGKDVKKESYTNPHSRPEYLVYELFKNMKIKDIDAIGKLYDTSFKRKSFDGNLMTNMLKNYTDIKFVSKFKTGETIIVRYDFVSTGKPYPYFAAVRETAGGFYLTMNINISNPFNTIGSYSPYNLYEKNMEPVNTSGMIPFYFINKENKVFFTNQLPAEDYSALYISFQFYNETTGSTEINFLNQLQKAAQSEDPGQMRELVANNELALLNESYYGGYFYSEIGKLFKNYPMISALASIKTSEGKVLYFKFAEAGQTSNIASIILKESQGKYYLSLQAKNNEINNVLQNTYIREAILDYLKNK